jgi:hypothetical protein
MVCLKVGLLVHDAEEVMSPRMRKSALVAFDFYLILCFYDFIAASLPLSPWTSTRWYP